MNIKANLKHAREKAEMLDLKNKKIMVVGAGISGIGAVHLLNQVGADVVLYDGGSKLSEDDVIKKLNGDKAQIILGEFSREYMEGIDMLVISPGVPIDNHVVVEFRKAGVPVWGEVELAYNYDKGTVLAITGTNGKTTTTALTGQIVGAWAKKTFVVGNIGNSYTKEVLNSDEDSYTVAEISSFQLETVHKFAPKVSAVLNITQIGRAHV